MRTLCIILAAALAGCTPSKPTTAGAAKRTHHDNYRKVEDAVRASLPGTRTISSESQTVIYFNGLGNLIATGWVDYEKPEGGVARKTFEVMDGSVWFKD